MLWAELNLNHNSEFPYCRPNSQEADAITFGKREAGVSESNLTTDLTRRKNPDTQKTIHVRAEGEDSNQGERPERSRLCDTLPLGFLLPRPGDKRFLLLSTTQSAVLGHGTLADPYTLFNDPF